MRQDNVTVVLFIYNRLAVALSGDMAQAVDLKIAVATVQVRTFLKHPKKIV
jgi:hypothetical protein